MMFSPAVFEQRIGARRAWIKAALRELAAIGHTNPALLTYCENLFAEYGASLTPKQALLREREYDT